MFAGQNCKGLLVSSRDGVVDHNITGERVARSGKGVTVNSNVDISLWDQVLRDRDIEHLGNQWTMGIVGALVKCGSFLPGHVTSNL